MATTVTITSTKVKPKKSKNQEPHVEDIHTDIPANPLSPPNEPQTPDEHGGVPVEPVDETESSPSRKRKRESVPAPELEINVNLPEPPSKKALRKAKKQKTSTHTPTKEVSGATDQNTDADSHKLPRTTPADADNQDGVDSISTSASRSVHGIWIGNLPFGATKVTLREFLISSSSGKIADAQITRLHMPAPSNAKATRTSIKPLNKGFAYVDFTTKEAMEAAVALSESTMGGRKVLIKNSKDFKGRPEKEPGTDGGDKANIKQPTKRVFVGNLGFDVLVADLREHFGKCGLIADVHMATFEDSGKCKGFAWVTFEELAAAEAAVRGWTTISTGAEDEEEDDEVQEGGKTATKPKKPKKKSRKWFVNKLQGRPIRCEFAEDATVRYKKRFGKDKEQQAPGTETSNMEEGPITEVSEESGTLQARNRKPKQGGIRPGAPTDPTMRRGRSGYEQGRDANITREVPKLPGAPDVKYRTGGIAESTGKKITF